MTNMLSRYENFVYTELQDADDIISPDHIMAANTKIMKICIVAE
jgi:hypothetical protein